MRDNVNRAIKPNQLNGWPPYVFFDKEFSISECETIIAAAKTIQPSPALTGGTAGTATANTEIRSSELRWMYHGEETKWIFDRLEVVAQKVHAQWYPFNLTSFQEALQITHYKASEGGHYDWHQDFGPGVSSTRKLSIVILLNDPSEFKGGELEMMGIHEESKAVKHVAQGTVIAFPSWEFHRVAKITEGQRWSLVTWIHGPLFS